VRTQGTGRSAVKPSGAGQLSHGNAASRPMRAF